MMPTAVRFKLMRRRSFHPYVPDSKTSALWIPLNGSERDALSTLIPRQVPHQGNGAHTFCVGCDC